MEIGIDSFAANFDEANVNVISRDAMQLLLSRIEHADKMGLAHQPIFDVSEKGADSIGLFWFSKKSAENISRHR